MIPWLSARTVLVVLLCLAGWVAAFTERLGSLLGNSSHEFGLGAIPTYDDRVVDWVLKEEPTARTFTTIVSGSRALLRWSGQKPVFIDGFFAPHPVSVLTDYRKALESQSPAELQRIYGIELALIENTNVEWNNVFLKSRQWRPVAIGEGMTVYAVRGSSAEKRPVTVLVDAKRAADLSGRFKHALATNYFSALLALVIAGETADARVLYESDPLLYAQLRPLLEKSQIPAAEAIDRLVTGKRN